MSPKIAAINRETYFKIRRERILDAAVQVFGEKGFSAASVAGIADAAQVAKGTIYLYFHSKDDIFTAILSERSFVPHLAGFVSDREKAPEQVLHEIALGYLDYIQKNLALTRLLMTDAVRFPQHARMVYQEVIMKSVEILAAYLADQAQRHTIRALKDPYLTARTFLGMLASYVLSQELLGGKYIQPISERLWAGEAVRVFVDGLRVSA
jgi:AcrR family transcriptional regulator